MHGRILMAVAFAIVLGTQPAYAQDLRSRDPRGDEVRKLEGEIARLKAQLQEVETRIKKAETPPATRRGSFAAFGGGFGPPRAGLRRGHGFQGFGGAQFQRHADFRGFGASGGSAFARASDSMKNVENKLDRVIQELERLRSEMRRR